MREPQIPILMYHRVCDVLRGEGSLPQDVPVRRFGQQMRFLRSMGYQSIPLDEAVDVVKNGATIPRKRVVITFDDGYRDTYRNALPILEGSQFTATVFLVSSLIGGSNEWDVEKGYPRVSLLSLDEVRDMKGRGISFGSHGATHRSLPSLDRLELEHEVRASKLHLEELLGAEIEFFCYPYCHTNQLIQGMVHEAGYLGACGGRGLEYHAYNLPRIEIGQDDWLRLWWKVSGWYYRVRRNTYLRTMRSRLAPKKGPRRE